MKNNPFTFAFLLGLLIAPFLAHAAESTSVRAILITATNLKREADPKLAAYEAELQRNIPLSSFRYVGESAATVTAAKPANLNLARGHRLVLEAQKGAGAGISLKVQWFSGEAVFMNTSIFVRSGGTAVLGRRPSGDAETPIVLLIAK